LNLLFIVELDGLPLAAGIGTWGKAEEAPGSGSVNRSNRFNLPGEYGHRNPHPFGPGLMAAHRGKPFAGAPSMKTTR